MTAKIPRTLNGSIVSMSVDYQIEQRTNMTEADYYTAPAQEVFDDIQKNAIKIWLEYDDTYGYASSKVDRVSQVVNVKDNAWYIVAMFDIHNQAKLLQRVKPQTREIIEDILSGLT